MITSIQLTNHFTGDLIVAPVDLECPAMKNSKHVLSEPYGTATDKALSEQIVPLRGHSQTPEKATPFHSTDGKLKSPQGETEHPGARTANVCDGEPDGDYIDAHNPYSYITCLGGQTYRKNCPPGKMWDNNSKSCAWQLK
ncbi:Endochitinase 1 [Desmophyllum pertusum]|uniref:Endochitinase 1 n=1 Tax=Desmophyllum pertusum TaxID=174260 RepID=A0A9W9YH12_9CNID|nr:Endochitinase 1 [Desmophyllum pertusum]